MSILSTLYSGAAGMTAQSDAMSVVGDNIANVNTVGFKTSRGTFYDLLGASLTGPGGDPSQIGAGVIFGSVNQVFSQGSFQSTGLNTDLALNGNGFFIVSGNQNGVNGPFYTRNGTFSLNNQGDLVNPQGLVVQGYAMGANGTLSTTLSGLKLAGQTMPPSKTTTVTASAALDSRAAVVGAWNANNASATSNFSTSVPVYDSLGQAHTAQVYFRNTGVNNTWEWHATVDGGEVAGGVKGTPFDFGDGTMAFTNTGALAQETTTNNTVSFAGGAAPNQVVAFDFGDAIAAGGTGQKGSNLAAQNFSMNRLDQDGFTAGTYSSMTVDSTGTINGLFTNGQHQSIGRVAVAGFASDNGLERQGGSLWSATRASGTPLVGQAGSGGLGQISSGALEQSNVDLTNEFVQMIALERGFQSNSKTIQTSDQNLQTLIGLKEQ